MLIGPSLPSGLASIGIASRCAEDYDCARRSDVEIIRAIAAVMTAVASHPIHRSGPPTAFVPMMSARLFEASADCAFSSRRQGALKVVKRIISNEQGLGTE